jgi:hypothetical protein
VLSTTNPVSSEVLVFPAGSVIVTVLLAPSSQPVPTTHVHTTSPLESAGFGLQFIPKIDIVDPSSTHCRVVATVVPSFAGFGSVLTSVGVFGAVSSTTSIGDEIFVF